MYMEFYKRACIWIVYFYARLNAIDFFFGHILEMHTILSCFFFQNSLCFCRSTRVRGYREVSIAG